MIPYNYGNNNNIIIATLNDKQKFWLVLDLCSYCSLFESQGDDKGPVEAGGTEVLLLLLQSTCKVAISLI